MEANGTASTRNETRNIDDAVFIYFMQALRLLDVPRFLFISVHIGLNIDIVKMVTMSFLEQTIASVVEFIVLAGATWCNRDIAAMMK
jgi:hypothetical protein